MGLQVTLVPIKDDDDDDDDLEPFHMLENATRDSSHQSNNHIVGWCDDEIIPEKKKIEIHIFRQKQHSAAGVISDRWRTRIRILGYPELAQKWVYAILAKTHFFMALPKPGFRVYPIRHVTNIGVGVQTYTIIYIVLRS